MNPEKLIDGTKPAQMGPRSPKMGLRVTKWSPIGPQKAHEEGPREPKGHPRMPPGGPN